MIDLAQQKEEMIERQLMNRGIKNKKVLSAMRKVPREEFIKKELVEFAYQDAPLPIEEDQTISQPFIVALMADKLELRQDDRVLDVGTGSGYAAAVMSRMVSEVYSIERHEVLAEAATERFINLEYDNIHVLHGDGTKGWPEHAPFDAINIAAGGPDIPQPLQDQLADGGRLIIPVGPKPRSQQLVRLIRKDGNLEKENLGRVQFVPLVSASGWSTESPDGEPVAQKQTVPEMIDRAVDPIPDIESANIDELIERIGDSSVVMMGEATHGTAEFYDMRARITKELIKRKGFNIVSVEADWTDAAHIDYYVRGTGVEPPEEEPFTRFPTWMWRNEQVQKFITWLKGYNERQEKPEDKAGFHGLDLYNMYASVEAVIRHLEDLDPALAETARERYGCLTPYQGNPTSYGAAAIGGDYRECEKNVTDMLQELLDSQMKLVPYDGERYHSIIQNARLVANAENYYRSMYYGSRSSWNLRDSHMFDTLQSLLEYRGPNARAVVWAHNSHTGNASATEMGARGEYNIGQLAREAFEDNLYSIGFGTDRGTVAAASSWGKEMEVMEINSSVENSYERLMHRATSDNFILPLHKEEHELLTGALNDSRLERAIGVVYRPKTELQSHYFQATLPEQFDEFIWFDKTEAITPLKTKPEEGDIAETFPFGI